MRGLNYPDLAASFTLLRSHPLPAHGRLSPPIEPFMRIGSLHIVDIAIVIAYLCAVVWIGKRAAKGNNSEDGFFLAGRKLGKLYQFFLNFGNATEPSGAVSSTSSPPPVGSGVRRRDVPSACRSATTRASGP